VVGKKRIELQWFAYVSAGMEGGVVNPAKSIQILPNQSSFLHFHTP